MKQKCFLRFFSCPAKWPAVCRNVNKKFKNQEKTCFFEDFTIYFKDGNMAVPFTRQKDKLLIRDICKNVKKWLKHP